jgi:uncharacterized protein (DUF2141 family)
MNAACFHRALLLTGLLAATVAHAADLTVTIKNVRSSDGAVFLAVYDSEASFMKVRLAKATRQAKAAKGEIKFVVENLPPGKYAVSSYHDENGNGKLDTNALGVPTEGYGFSRDAQGTFGPPDFVHAAFNFDAKSDMSIAISFNY